MPTNVLQLAEPRLVQKNVASQEIGGVYAIAASSGRASSLVWMNFALRVGVHVCLIFLPVAIGVRIYTYTYANFSL